MSGSDGNKESGGKSEDYQLGVSLVSILVSIAISVGFSIYSITDTWWLAVVAGLVVPAMIAMTIRIGGHDGWIAKLGKWILGSA